MRSRMVILADDRNPRFGLARNRYDFGGAKWDRSGFDHVLWSDVSLSLTICGNAVVWNLEFETECVRR